MEKLVKIKENISNFIKEHKDYVIGFLQEHKKIVLSILAGLIVIITILVVWSTLGKQEMGNTAGNLYGNHGIAAQSGKWVYYMWFDDNKPAGIYRVKENGKKTEKVNEGYYEYINVVSKYIYCIERDADKGEFNLVKIKTNGKTKEVLASNIDSKPITVANDKIYYFKEGIFYCISVNGTDRKKLSDKDIRYYEISNNKIYYIFQNESDSYIAYMKKNGEKSVNLGKLEDSEYIALHVKGNQVYYIMRDSEDENAYKLYKMNKKNGGKVQRIYSLSNRVEYINMQDDAVYFATRDGDIQITSINYKAAHKIDLKKIEKLDAIGTSKKWVYYVTESEDNEIIMERINKKGEKEQSL